MSFWRAVARRLVDRRFHGRWQSRLFARHLIHQDTTLTWRDRYPRLFAASRDLLGGDGEHRILSFGCAAGDEVLSLRDYFPRAAIVGAEINRAELAICRKLAVDPGIEFIRSARDPIARLGPFDAIFCMAVLQRRPEAVARDRLTNIARLYAFDRFADEIAFLTQQLRAGGLLVVEHSQYRVEDSAAAEWLEPVGGVGDWPAKGPRFRPDGELIQPPQPIARIFRKRRTPSTGPVQRGSIAKHETMVKLPKL